MLNQVFSVNETFTIIGAAYSDFFASLVLVICRQQNPQDRQTTEEVRGCSVVQVLLTQAFPLFFYSHLASDQLLTYVRRTLHGKTEPSPVSSLMSYEMCVFSFGVGSLSRVLGAFHVGCL